MADPNGPFAAQIGANLVVGTPSGPGGVGGSLVKVGTGTLTLTGTNTYTGGTSIDAGTLQLGNGVTTGSIVGNVLNNAAFVFDPGTAVPLTLAGVISGAGTVDQISPGTTILSGANTYSGNTTVSAGILQAGALDTFSPNSAVTVATAGALDLAGFNQTVGGLTNAGLVNMGTGTPPGTLLTTPNYVGQGGTIAMNTFLGADNSPSDQLVINGGTASGNSNLLFANAGGPGALTMANGILVVNTINGATTAAGSFTMANPELRAGIYDYRLFQGGINGDDPYSWYLRSTFTEGGGGPDVTPPDVLPPEPPPTGPGTYPIIGPEIATYGVVQPIAGQLGIASLGTHDERMTNIDQAEAPCAPSGVPITTKAPVYYTKAPSVDCGAAGWRPAVWGRVFGQQINNHYQAFADPRADGRIAGLQAGVDLLRGNSMIDGHRDYGGVYFAYGNANVDVTGLITPFTTNTGYVLQHTGALNLNAYSGGAYWTHYGVPGWYIDLTLQGTSYSGAATTEFAHLNTTGSGFVSSLEGGYPIQLPQFGPGFVLEPQAQVAWQWVSFDSANDGLGQVALGTTTTTIGRLGLKGKWTITTDRCGSLMCAQICGAPGVASPRRSSATRASASAPRC